jgi:hypothetical protein
MLNHIGLDWLLNYPMIRGESSRKDRGATVRFLPTRGCEGATALEDCANNNYSCAQEHARQAVQSWLQSVGGTHVDTVTCCSEWTSPQQAYFFETCRDCGSYTHKLHIRLPEGFQWLSPQSLTAPIRHVTVYQDKAPSWNLVDIFNPVLFKS